MRYLKNITNIKLWDRLLYVSTRPPKCTTIHQRNIQSKSGPEEFEPVFSLPPIKYFAIFNRLKVYHILASALAIPGAGLLEIANIFPPHSFTTTAYIGLSAGALLFIGSIPSKNIIGFLYISKDNKKIKISSVDYWGKRINQIIPADDWIPLLDMPSKTTDIFFLSPELADGTKYKLFNKFGNIHNSKKMAQVLE